MERRVGKYLIDCTKEEISEDNFRKHDFIIDIAPTFTIVHGDELSFRQAKILRYGAEEKQITDILKEIIQSRFRGLTSLKLFVE